MGVLLLSFALHHVVHCLALNTHIPLTALELVKLGWIILVALEDRFDLRHRRSGSVAIGKAAGSPRLDDLITACPKGAAVKLLASPYNDAPIDWATKWAMIRVVALIDNFFGFALNLSDGRHERALKLVIWVRRDADN